MAESKIEQLIDDIFEFVESSKSPFTNHNKVTLHKDELYDMLDELKMRTPEEIKKYQKIIANRDKIIADAQNNADIIIEQANNHAAAIVDESVMVHQANERAEEIIAAANNEANIIVSRANEEAMQIRVGAIQYTNDLLSNAESIIQNAYKNTKARYDLVFEALKEDLDVITANKKDLAKDMPQSMREELGIELDNPPVDDINKLIDELES